MTPRTVSEEVVLKALKLTSHKISDKKYVIGHIVSFNDKFQKWECSCTFNSKTHTECAELAKFYMDSPEKLKR